MRRLWKTFFKLFNFLQLASRLLGVFVAAAVVAAALFLYGKTVRFLSYTLVPVFVCNFCEHQENMVRPFVWLFLFLLFLLRLSLWRIYPWIPRSKKNMLPIFLQFVLEIRLVFGCTKALYFCTRSSFELLLLSLALFHSKFATAYDIR